MNKQRGMVLFLALIVLIIMTVIGVALAVNSGQSLRMSGAGAERLQAMAVAQGQQAKAIFDNRGASLANISAAGIQISDTTLNTASQIMPLTLGDVNCQRSPKASGANLISCKRTEISTTTTFGRKGLGQLTVVSGVEQQVLTGSGS